MSADIDQAEKDITVVAFARRHAGRKELSAEAAKTLILGLAAKLERYAREKLPTIPIDPATEPGSDE
jgi:hypothetical protein